MTLGAKVLPLQISEDEVHDAELVHAHSAEAIEHEGAPALEAVVAE